MTQERPRGLAARVLLPVDHVAYEAVRGALLAAGYVWAVRRDAGGREYLDLHGMGLAPPAGPEVARRPARPTPAGQGSLWDEEQPPPVLKAFNTLLTRL